MRTAAWSDPLRVLAAYYVATGVWPVVHLRSFMALTGPKTDTWLVRTFGAFIAALGIGLWPGRSSHRPAHERMAVLGAVSLAVCDAVFVARGRISPIYLADAAAESLLAAAILGRRARGRNSSV